MSVNEVFSSLGLKAPGGVYRRAPSYVVARPFTISTDFSETTGPIGFNFQPPEPLGTKVCSNGLGHMN